MMNPGLENIISKESILYTKTHAFSKKNWVYIYMYSVLLILIIVITSLILARNYAAHKKMLLDVKSIFEKGTGFYDYKGYYYYTNGGQSFRMDKKTNQKQLLGGSSLYFIHKGRYYLIENDTFYSYNMDFEDERVISKDDISIYCIYKDLFYFSYKDKAQNEIYTMNLDGTDIAKISFPQFDRDVKFLSFAYPEYLFYLKNGSLYKYNLREETLSAAISGIDEKIGFEGAVFEGGHVYLTFENDLYRLSLNGSVKALGEDVLAKHKIAENVKDFLVNGKQIYYLSETAGNGEEQAGGKISVIDKNGKNGAVLLTENEPVALINVIKDKVYFKKADGKIYCYNKGEITEVIS